MTVGPMAQIAGNAEQANASGRTAGALQAHLLLMISCLPVLGMLVIAPVLPAMQRHFAHVQGVDFLVPFALTAPALMVVLISPFAGHIATRLGRRRTLSVALLIYFFAATSPLLLDSLWGIVATRLIVGVAEALLMTVATMLLGDYFESHRRERYLAYQIFYTSVSAVLFLLIGGILGESGWRTPFAAYGSALLLLPLVLLLIWEPSAPAGEQSGSASRTPWRRLWPVFLITFVAGGCMNLVAVELGYLIEELGMLSSLLKGVAAAVNSAGIAVGSITLGLIAQKERIAFLVLSFLLAGAGFALMALSSGATGVIVGGGLAGMASGFYLGWLLTAVNRPLTFETRGRGVGIWMASYFLATVLAPVAMVALSGMMGGFQPAMLVFAAVLTMLAIVSPAMLRGVGS